MKRSRFSEEQIIGVLKEHQAGLHPLSGKSRGSEQIEVVVNRAGFAGGANIIAQCKWPSGKKRSFLSLSPAPPQINDLAGTKLHDKTFAVSGGFWHDAA